MGGAGAILEMPMAHFKFVPEKLTKSFYIYNGSQTQPPCYQRHWIVSKVQFAVLREQIEQLKQVKDIFQKPILKNVRDIQ